MIQTVFQRPLRSRSYEIYNGGIIKNTYVILATVLEHVGLSFIKIVWFLRVTESLNGYRFCWQDFTSDFYFRQSWRDERLSFAKSKELTQMTVGAEVAGKIWVPDTFFANEKTAYFHTATTPNTFLRIGSDGDVYRSIR